jgi:AcrR family transcriptional regulator
LASQEHSKGNRTRRRLLDAAAAELARHGRSGVSLNAIAAAAGLKTGSIYFHFDSKEQLIEAVLEQGLRATLDYLDTALATAGTHAAPAARLRAAIEAHAVAVHELRDYTVVVLAPDFAAQAGNDNTAVFHELRHDYVERWTRLVADTQRCGALPGAVDARLVRDLLFGAINAVSLAGRPSSDVAGAVHALLRLADG